MSHQVIDQPVLLGGESFTPPRRTPWGGQRIRALKGLEPGPIVGESWELSVEPSFPSRLADGRRLDSTAPDTALLVKLLDARDVLSVQIHPSDADPSLSPDECGKPEAWYVIAREPGAGIYIGLTEDAEEASLREAIETGADVSRLLSFVPVEPGDFFVIAAGTPHCIGAGVFLVEPQRVLPGKRGVTYRYWDWARTYDSEGRRDPAGTPRELHLERALEVTRWDLPRGRALLDHIRVRAGRPPDEARVEPLNDGELRVSRVAGTGSVLLPSSATLAGLTVLEGSVTLGELEVPRGRTAALPPSWAPRRARLASAHAILASA